MSAPPWSPRNVLGQDGLLRRLEREFSLGRPAHAYLLEGPEGTGKLTLARGMAARLFCQAADAGGGACGVCRPCLLLAGGNHPDYLELPRTPAELRLGRFLERQAGSELVDHQPLIPFLRLKPVESAWRAAVVPAAERMRSESANAFLKTLEEPPGRRLIILTVNFRDSLPPTIASRCRRLGLSPLPDAMVAAELSRRGVASGKEAAELARAAEGSLGKALELAEGPALALWRWLEDEAFANPGAPAAKDLIDAWRSYVDAAGDGAEKRGKALAALDLAALVMRRRLRLGREPAKAGLALEILWRAGGQLAHNVRPDSVLLSAAFEIMAALRRREEKG